LSKRSIGFAVLTGVLFLIFMREVRGDFVSIRSAAFGAFRQYMKEVRVDQGLFKGPFLDLTNDKYFVFNWYYKPNDGSDTVRVSVYVPPYFYGFRTEVGGKGVEKIANTGGLQK
jgi:hypothetical protein